VLSWLGENVVRSAVKDVEARDDGLGELVRVILDQVRYVRRPLVTYWRSCVRNYMRRQRYQPTIRQSLRCPGCEGKGGTPPFVCRQCGLAVPRGFGAQPRRVALAHDEGAREDRLGGIAQLEDYASAVDELDTFHELRRRLPPLLSQLTDRQCSITALEAKGYTEKEMADKLGCSTRTVQLDRQKIRKVAATLRT
jgi:DNA-binding CsgD family transcriptional regulator